MIFGRRQIAPTTRSQVNIRPHTQVRSMYMRMRAVRMNQITQAEPLAHPALCSAKSSTSTVPAMASTSFAANDKWSRSQVSGTQQSASVFASQQRCDGPRTVEGRCGCDRSRLSDDTNLG